jgi:hypothetical protein
MSITGEAGTDPKIGWAVSPTGGIVTLRLGSNADSETWTLTRGVVSGGVVVESTTLFQFLDTPPLVFVDIGDQLQTPLDPTKLYRYTFTTVSGSVSTDDLSPAVTLTLEPDSLTQILIRALQAGLRSLVIPTEFKKRPSVFHAMPMGSLPPLPFVSVNDTLLQQDSIPIGQNSVPMNTENRYAVGGLANHGYTIAIFTTTSQERTFYKNAVIGIFTAALGPIMEAIGENATHRFIANSSQMVSEDTQPGFYYVEIGLEMVGNFQIGVSTQYGVINEIDFTDTNTGDEVIVPPH